VAGTVFTRQWKKLEGGKDLRNTRLVGGKISKQDGAAKARRRLSTEEAGKGLQRLKEKRGGGLYSLLL